MTSQIWVYAAVYVELTRLWVEFHLVWLDLLKVGEADVVKEGDRGAAKAVSLLYKSGPLVSLEWIQ